MAKDVNETIINIDHIDHIARTAHVWTCNRRVTGRLRRLGAPETRRQIGGVWFQLPERSISFRKPTKKATSEATGAILAKVPARS